MTLCASCGLELSGYAAADGVCLHHHPVEEGWAASNRVMCDFFHRGIVRARLPQDVRVDTCIADAAGWPSVATE
jgi:hypothetical protein